MKLYELLVPTHSREGVRLTDEFHKGWDKVVCDITGGLTLLKTVKGSWVSDSGTVKETMIPVRIAMEESEVDKIVDITLSYYEQEAVMIYIVSENVVIKKNPNKDYWNE
jgi:hypothetical protein